MALDDRLRKEPMEIEHLYWITEGFSGSPVALIRLERMGRPPIEAILKFYTERKNEVQGLASAYENAGEGFPEAHMVKPFRSFPLREWTAVFLEIAGGDLRSYKAVAEFSDKDELADICVAVIRSLLYEWNSGTVRRNSDTNVGQFLEGVIGKDRIRETTSNLADFARETHISWDELWIERDGQPGWLVNPLALTEGITNTEINAIIGFGHGDLSVHNVLVPTVPQLRPDGFMLIDYGTFSYEYSLARDPMYLLVSLATQWLKDIKLPSSRSNALARELARVGPQTPDLGLGGYRKVIDAIFDAGYEWSRSQVLGHHWMPQCFLALAGSALTFIGRDIPDLDSDAVNNWLFDLAALVAKEHLRDYVPLGHASPTPANHATPYDRMRQGRPVSRVYPAQPTAASGADMSQASATPSAEQPTEGNGAYDDRADALTNMLESAMAQLREELRAVGQPPTSPQVGGIGRWLVRLGYWTDGADSVLSKIISFTYAHCNDPPDQFAQAVDDAQSAIRKIMDLLPAETTTVRDATTLAIWASDLWSLMAQLLPLSMEACGLGHVLLAADDQLIATASSGPLPGPSGIQTDPGLEILMVRLDSVRSALQPVVDAFLRKRPSDSATDLLLGRLDDLFKDLDRCYLPQLEGGQRINLERVRKAVRLAALGLSRLIDSASSSDDEFSAIHEELSRLIRALDDILPVDDSRDEQ